jgi:hypothetical protein
MHVIFWSRAGGKRILSYPVTFLEDDMRTRTGFLVARIGRPAREPT